MSNNIFLDLGTNLGQGLKKFQEMFNLLNNPDWLIHCFEPNTNIDLDSLFPEINNIKYHNKAIWIENTFLEFRKQGHKHDNLTGLGSKLECVNKASNPSNCSYKIDNIEAIDLAEFLRYLKNENPNSSIYVKMDIEGAEFEVLNHLIETKTIKLIKELYCECHGRFQFPIEEHKNKETKDKIFAIENELKNKVEECGVKFYFWD